MFNQSKLPLPFVVTFMVSSMTCWNCSTKEVKFQIHVTSLWVTLWTEASTQLRHSNFFYASSWSILLISLCWEAITKPDRLLLSMVSTTKQSESTETPIRGSTARRCSTTLALELWLRARSSASMEVCLRRSRQSIRWDLSTEEWRSRMKALSATLCGLILKTSRLGLCLQEEQVGCSAQKWPLSSTTSMTFLWLRERTSWWWTGTSTGSETKTWWLCGLRQTTATDAVTWLQSWTFRTRWRRLSTSSTLWETRRPEQSLTRL